VPTFLAHEQVREAEGAFRRLEGRAKSLTFYLDFALANYREPEREMPVEKAVAAYLASREQDRARDLLSASMLGQIKWELDALQRRFPSQTVAQLKADCLKPFFERGRPSLKTYNNRRGLVGTFLKFAFQQDWIVANPVEKMPHFRIAHRRGSAVTLTAARCAELMAEVETVTDGLLVPYFALCLFAGIRPSVRDGEISKLKARDINLETGAIHVEPEVSKVRMKRIVTIQANLAAWLRAYPFKPINAHAIEHFRKPVVKQFGLTHDVLRHTFISMFVAKFRSMGEAALQAGNSESIIRKHYLDLKSPAEAEQFFGIVPKLRTLSVTLPQTLAQVDAHQAA
jgi:integrase